jgi:hypothetical protein
MLWILAILGLVTALWKVAYYLKDAGPPMLCIDHRCACVGFELGRAGDDGRRQPQRDSRPW